MKKSFHFVINVKTILLFSSVASLLCYRLLLLPLELDCAQSLTTTREHKLPERWGE